MEQVAWARGQSQSLFRGKGMIGMDGQKFVIRFQRRLQVVSSFMQPRKFEERVRCSLSRLQQQGFGFVQVSGLGKRFPEPILVSPVRMDPIAFSKMEFGLFVIL